MTEAARRKEDAFALTPYLVLGVFVLLLALVVRAPASLLQKALPESSPLRVAAWGGTVWNGQAAFLQGGESGQVRWQLRPRRLLSGRLAFATRAQGALDLEGTAELGLGGWQLQNLRGDVPLGLFQSMLPPGWTLPGSVQAEQVQLARSGFGDGAWLAASGRLRWPGGPMQYTLGSRPQGITLPPLVAVPRLDGDALVLSLNEEAGNLALAEVRIGADGAMETRLRERLLRYSNRSSGGDPDAVVVTMRQKPR